MNKITQMTSEQEVLLQSFREDSRAKALRTHFASDSEMRDAVTTLYVSRGLNAPKVFVFDDPLQCLWARAILIGKGGGQLRDQLGDQLGDQLWGQLRDQLGGQLWDQLRGQLGGQLWDQLGDQLWGQLRDQLRGQLGDQLWDQLGGQLWDQLGDQLWDQLRGQLGDQLWDQLGGQLRDVHDSLWFSGGSEFYWIAYYQFAEKIGVKFTNEQSNALAAWAIYAKICGPLYPYLGAAFVSRRPDILEFDDQLRLHCETGPAMRFASGYSVFSWHGTRVPAAWVMDKDKLNAADVLGTQDGNVRAAGIAIMGWARLADDLDAKVVDRHPEGMAGGELLSVKKSRIEAGASGTMRLLRAECPRNGVICFRVPDEIKTAHEAQAWSRGLPPEIFQLPSIRT